MLDLLVVALIMCVVIWFAVVTFVMDPLPEEIIQHLTKEGWIIEEHRADGDGWQLHVRRFRCERDIHVRLTDKGIHIFPKL